MSIDLMNLAYQKQVDAKTQRVLVILCDFANDAGVCWPSIDRIAWKLGVSERTVMRAIQGLETAGAVEVTRRHRRGNVYRLRLDRLDDKPPYIPPYDDAALGDSLSGLGDKMSDFTCQNVTPTTIEPPKNQPPTPKNVIRVAAPAQSPAPPSKTRGRKTDDPGFDRFWDAYPNTDEKKKARDAWAKIDPDPELVETILAAVERQKLTRKWRDGFVKAAFRWLRDENWNDGGVKSETVQAQPPVDLLPGETAVEVEPNCWELTAPGGRKRRIRPEYHGVIFDERKHLYSGLDDFRRDVEEAKRRSGIEQREEQIA